MLIIYDLKNHLERSDENRSDDLLSEQFQLIFILFRFGFYLRNFSFD